MNGKRPYPKPPTVEKSNRKCWHAPLNRGAERKVQWFKVGDEDFKAFKFKIITATKFSNDMRNCSSFMHTGALEALHNSKLKYLPKYKAFTLGISIIMMMFISLELNHEGSN